MIIEDFRNRLKKAVKTAGGGKKISQLAGIPLSTLSGYLGGATSPTIQKIADIAIACDVSLDWLVHGIENKSISKSDQQIDKATIDEAIVSIDRILIETNKEIEPSKKPELVWAMYELLANKSKEKPDNIINLLKYIS